MVPKRVYSIAALCCVALAPWAAAIDKGETAPPIAAQTIFGEQVILDAIIEEGRDLVILHLFTPESSEDIALKLSALDLRYGGEQLEIIALGVREDEDALRTFAQSLGIEYFVIDDDALGDVDWLNAVDILPLTAFVVADETRVVERVIRGGGTSMGRLVLSVAENFFQQRKLDQAHELLQEAANEDDTAEAAQELQGYMLTAAGKLDEAEAAFAAIESDAGLATVALARGDYEEAISHAADSDDPYAQVVASKAKLQIGDVEGSAATAAAALAQLPEEAGWKASEAANVQARAAHVQGATDSAAQAYDDAVKHDPYNVVALSNHAALDREQGNLDSAQTRLERAARLREDDTVAFLLAEVRDELAAANDTSRQELIRQQISDLREQYEQAQAEGTAAADTWTTRPPVLALLPGRQSSPVVLARAGMDVALQRALEQQLNASDAVTVVEREMLDALLQELNLGSSELADPTTQRRLGTVMSAGLLGFISYGTLGGQPTAYLRLVDSETTEIVLDVSQPLRAEDLAEAADTLSAAVVEHLRDETELRGLVAEVTATGVFINLGERHGVEAGRAFTVLADGEPIEVAGRVIAHRQRPIGTLTVTQLEDDYAICEADLNDGVALEKEMKVIAR